jgi:uncharacterized protein (DUF305 family)
MREGKRRKVVASGLVLLALFAGCKRKEQTTGGGASGPGAEAPAGAASPAASQPPLAMNEPVPLPVSASYDVRALDTLAAYHQQGVEICQLAIEKAQAAGVRALAQRLLDAQTTDAQQLAQWRREWFPGAGDAHDMTMPGAHVMNDVDVGRLRATSGGGFDGNFVVMMMQHHQGAIELERDAADRAEHPELRRQALAMADRQQQERDELARLVRQ